MPFNRREFMEASVAAASLALLPAATFGAADRKLRILFLGGTGFLGPHTVRYALERGHDVTLFNRGRTNTELFPELETIIGNRDPEIDEGLDGLKGREWDAVIDTSGYVPRITGASAELLADSVGQYLFVSTICQYDNWAEGGTNGTEERARATLDDPTTEDVRTHYCALKAYCELAVEAAMPGRVTQIRPGLIVGPRDGTDRFTYWPVRIDRGGEVLAPGKPSDLTQYIDVRDLGRFMVHCLEQGLADTYNVVRSPMPFGDLLSACLATIDSDAELTWVPADFLADHDLQAWRDIPAWADSDSALAGSLTWSANKALSAGLTISPVENTIRDTLAWFRSLPDERQAELRAGMSRDKEASVLEAWHSFEQDEGK
jgi:2'-hydroxyisoflavone reductase